MKANRYYQLRLGSVLAVLLATGCTADTDTDTNTAMTATPAVTPTEQPPAASSSQGGLPAIQTGEDGVLNRPDTLAFCYGGYRGKTRDDVPTVAELKEDLKILAAMKVNLIRTYNTQQFAHAANLLAAIEELKSEDTEFEMFVMLGAWIDCEGAWTDQPNHAAENTENNTAEIEAAVELANKHPEVVKIIAVGNEAMVHWAATYFVSADVILKWVTYLQGLKQNGGLPKDVRITSSDNFASWGGESSDYHTDALADLIRAVDYISLHTYPFHDTHYNSEFWISPAEDASLSPAEKAQRAVDRAMLRATSQYQQTAAYVKSLGVDKPIHIGETGWASVDSVLYGAGGSGAADEYKSKLFYDAMRQWTRSNGISCFYFEAFDEHWKDATNTEGSENHFGLITSDGQAKFALWDLVDSGAFAELARGGKPITRTFGGDATSLMNSLLEIPSADAGGSTMITTVNDQRNVGEPVSEQNYIVLNKDMVPSADNGMTYPGSPLKVNVWEGTCGMGLTADGTIEITTGTGARWGCGLEIQGNGKGENLTAFKDGLLHFEIRGDTTSNFAVGFQTGVYADGTQTNNFVTFGPDAEYRLTSEWKSWSISVAQLNRKADLSDVTAVVYFRGDAALDGRAFEVRNIHYSQN